jgi:hypothetical protein
MYLTPDKQLKDDRVVCLHSISLDTRSARMYILLTPWVPALSSVEFAVFELTQKAGRVAPFRPMVFIPQSAGFWGQNFCQQTLDIKKPGVPLQLV